MRNPDRAPELASIGEKERLPIKVLLMDVDHDASVGEAVAGILAEAGRIDVLVNNAGVAVTGSVEELPLSEFRRVMETNYFGALRCIQAVVPGMREQRSGHIINVSSIQGRMSVPSYAAYAASKWALEAASEALAQEAKSFGIKVSIVEPGMIATSVGTNGATFLRIRVIRRSAAYMHSSMLFSNSPSRRSWLLRRSSRSCRAKPGNFVTR